MLTGTVHSASSTVSPEVCRLPSPLLEVKVLSVQLQPTQEPGSQRGDSFLESSTRGLYTRALLKIGFGSGVILGPAMSRAILTSGQE